MMTMMNRYIKAPLIILLVFSTISFAGQFKVNRVIDGDTIKITGNGSKATVRFVGIDAPETYKKKNQPGQPFSRKSTKYLASLVLNKTVEIKSYGTDRYGRILGEVYVSGTNVNLEMVKAGLAEVYRGRPASGLDMDPYWNAEAQAKKAGRGLWSLGDKYVSPRDLRRGNRN